MMRTSIAAGVLATVLALAACSSSGTKSGTSNTPAATNPASAPAKSTGAATTASGPTIKISGFAFSGDLTVKPGAKVTVVNMDTVAHTLTDKLTHKFDTGSIAPSGGKGTFTAPTAPGSYKFGCTFHPEMAGTLVVKA